MDADVRVDSVFVEEGDTSYTVVHGNDNPMMEVYALARPLSGSPTSESWDEDLSFPVPIPRGNNRLVKVDVTRLVERYLAEPSGHYGLVIGSLTNRREGLFTLREGFGTGVRARIRFMY